MKNIASNGTDEETIENSTLDQISVSANVFCKLQL